ncbi:putative COP9 signalosome complex subunit 4 [Blattamonas nauphoetae]|uniref:COP9 signalosome complex subunit 4 n=1 Tax=Blattamonas nauphoetae TaxID=2049346 RepID=A0ABQ9XMV1_9EUKA|nr:putative COP9 signalosome complex subunit 4 [Blattamonas nauphoetae]
MSKIASRVQKFAKKDLQDKITGYQDILQNIISPPKEEDLIEFFKCIIPTEAPQVSYNLTDTFSNSMALIPDSIQINVGKVVIELIEGKPSSHFDNSEFIIRRIVAEKLEHLKQYGEAAKILEVSLSKASNHSKKEICILYTHYSFCLLMTPECLNIKSYDPKDLETIPSYVKANDTFALALSLKDRIDDDVDRIPFMYTDALIAEIHKKFESARQKFYSLSLVPNVPNSEQYLIRTVQNALLSPPGEARDKFFATLVADSRTHSLPHYPVLLQFCQHKLISEAAVKQHSLRSFFLPPQLPFLDPSLIKSNIVSLSLIYSNITLLQLTTLLEMEPTTQNIETVETFAAELISSGLIDGSIDQIMGVIKFHSQSTILTEWDGQLNNLLISAIDSCDLMDLHGLLPQKA